MQVDQAKFQAAVSALNGIFTKEQVRSLFYVLEGLIANTVKATPAPWDDMMFATLDKLVFNDATVEKLCALLGIA